MRLVDFIGRCGELLLAFLGPGGRLGAQEVTEWEHFVAVAFNHGLTPEEAVGRWAVSEAA